MRILMSAGEPSGVLLADLLAKSVTGLEPEARIELLPMRTKGVLGFGAGLAAAPALRRELARAARTVVRTRPDLVVLVAYSGFNLPFGRHCRMLGVPTLFLSPPQVWAWGTARVALLRRSADQVCTLFDFEERLLRSAGINAVYSGYPLLDHVLGRLATEPLPTGLVRPYVVLLPGSRPAERRYHVPLFESLFLRLRSRSPGLNGVIVLPDCEPGPAGLAVVRDSRYAVIRDAACAVLASGTVTLEAAIAGTAMVVTYHLSRFSRAVARSVLRTRFFALPNILAGQSVVPEMLDPDVEDLAAEVIQLLEGSARVAEVKRDLALVRSRLGPPGAMARIAELAVDLARRGAS